MQDPDRKLVSQQGPSGRLRRQRWVRWVALTGSVLVGAATIVAAFPAVRDVFSARSQASVEGVIIIDSPDRGRVSTCATVRGSAPVKDGLVLWAGVEGYDFVFSKVTREEGNRWRLSKRIGGPESVGRTFQIHAFYLNERDGQFLEGASAAVNDGRPTSVHYKKLPPGAQGLVTRTVVHDGSDGSC